MDRSNSYLGGKVSLLTSWMWEVRESQSSGGVAVPLPWICDTGGGRQKAGAEGLIVEQEGGREGRVC